MKKIATILIFTLTVFFISCKKEKLSVADSQGDKCMQDPPAWCATVRCTPDGKPVCGCNKITYGSACEAQCAGVISYTYGTCK